VAGTYEQSTTIAAGPDEVFAYVSDISRLPEYLPPIEEASARPLAEGTETDPAVRDAQGVHLVGEMKGQRFENDGWFDVDPDARSLTWGAQTERTYGGTLTVTPDGDGSRVSVQLRFGERSQDEQIQAQSGDRDPLREAFDATLESIKNQVEGTGGKVVPPPPPGDLPDPSGS
jgi:uncharacterized protein YndB with AHSA1/START domain